MHLKESEFLNRLLEGIYGPRKGGARIIVDAQHAATGVGKTSLAISLMLFLSRIFGYSVKPADLTLSGQEYLDRWREHPDKEQPSVIVLDELSGGGAGDSRKAMTNQNVKLGRSWQVMRKKRIVSITTLPHWRDADSRMRRAADFRLNCLKKPIGYFRAYEVGASFDKGKTQTHRLDETYIKFPNLDAANNPLYDYLADRKDELIESGSFDADDVHQPDQEGVSEDEVRASEKKRTAQKLRQKGLSVRDIADVVDMSTGWVSKHTREQSDVENRNTASG